MTMLDVWVPFGLRHGTISRGSAIVSKPYDNGSLVVVYYEGNLYDAVNLRRYPERLRQAAGRLVANYPTTAKMALPVGSLVRIGTYDYEADRFRFDFREKELALSLWIMPEPFPEEWRQAS